MLDAVGEAPRKAATRAARWPVARACVKALLTTNGAFGRGKRGGTGCATAAPGHTRLALPARAASP
eukprot:10383301-Alexandrium_andersonii.AAC.1